MPAKRRGDLRQQKQNENKDVKRPYRKKSNSVDTDAKEHKQVLIKSKKRTNTASTDSKQQAHQKKKTKFRNEYASVDDCFDKTERFADCADDQDYSDILEELENAKHHQRKPLPEIKRLFPAHVSLTPEKYELFLDLKNLYMETQSIEGEAIEARKRELQAHIEATIEDVYQLDGVSISGVNPWVNEEQKKEKKEKEEKEEKESKQAEFKFQLAKPNNNTKDN
jgi:hypothetical protein